MVGAFAFVDNFMPRQKVEDCLLYNENEERRLSQVVIERSVLRNVMPRDLLRKHCTQKAFLKHLLHKRLPTEFCQTSHSLQRNHKKSLRSNALVLFLESLPKVGSGCIAVLWSCVNVESLRLLSVIQKGKLDQEPRLGQVAIWFIDRTNLRSKDRDLLF